MQSQRNQLYSQLQENYASIIYSYRAHYKMADELLKKNRNIKLTTTICSALVSGGLILTLFSPNSQLSDLGAVIAAILSTVVIFINLFFSNFHLEREAAEHRNTAHELWKIREQYASLLTDFKEYAEETKIKKIRDELQQEVYYIYKNSNAVNNKAFDEAKKMIAGGASCFTKDQIDNVLPHHLRGEYKN